MGLKEYKAKRDFSRTTEPVGREHAEKRRANEFFFVVQKHAARRLHYDFRLEMEGVLKSWAVPKGFPMTKGDKRLAVHVEDHPIEYANFEGVIAPGNYGAGTVMVWDRGTYTVSGDQPLESLANGKLHLRISGQKLKGEWTLIKLRPRKGDKDEWLLLKTGSDAKPISARRDDQSVVSKRSLRQIAAGQDAEWKGNRAVVNAPKTPRRDGRKSADSGTTGARNRIARGPAGEKAVAGLDDLPKARPRFIEPMKRKEPREVVREIADGALPDA